MNDLIQRAAHVGGAPSTARRFQLHENGWQGPTITIRSGTGSIPPAVDCSTWICPHTPHCNHYTPCLKRYQLEHGR